MLSFFSAFVGLCLLMLCVSVEARAFSTESDSLYKHDPYDISQGGVINSADVYVTKVNHFSRLPRYVG